MLLFGGFTRTGSKLCLLYKCVRVIGEASFSFFCFLRVLDVSDRMV